MFLKTMWNLLLFIGCDRSMYSVKSDLLHQEKNTKVKSLAKNLNEAKARMLELKKDDGDQAKDFFKSKFLYLSGVLEFVWCPCIRKET